MPGSVTLWSRGSRARSRDLALDEPHVSFDDSLRGDEPVVPPREIAVRLEVTNTQPVGVEVSFDQGCAVDELRGRVSPAQSEPRPRRMWRSSSLVTRPGRLVWGLGGGV